jgi:hypothetical protein
MMASVTDIEAARLAGFFDADGSVGIYHHWKARGAGKSYALRVTAAGVHHESMQRFKDAFGGSLYLTRKANRPWKSNHKRDLWQWSVCASNAKVALGTMLPYLIVKKAQAFEALKMPIGRAEKGYKGRTPEDQAYAEVLRDRIFQLKKEVA